MKPTIWTIAGLIASSYYAYENPVCWIWVAWFTVPFIVEATS